MCKKFLCLNLFAFIFLLSLSAANANEIIDEVAIQSFADKNLSKPIFDNKIIEDEAVKNELNNNYYAKITIDNSIIEDDAVTKNENLKTAVKPVIKLKLINENAEIIKIPISSIFQINTENNTIINEGQTLTFKVLKNIYKNGDVFIAKGTPVSALVETLTQPSFGGDPAEIHIGRFTTIDINGKKVELTGEIQKQGANRAIWVRPLADIVSWGSIYGTPLMLLYFVKGGDVKIDTNHEFVLCFE